MKTYIWKTEFEVIIVNAESEEFARALALSKYQLQMSDVSILTFCQKENPDSVEVVYTDRSVSTGYRNDYTYEKIERQLQEPAHFILESNSALIYTHANE